MTSRKFLIQHLSRIPCGLAAGMKGRCFINPFRPAKSGRKGAGFILIILAALLVPAAVWAKPPAPLNVKAADTAQGREIKITWQRPTLGLVLDYNIYRSTNSNSLGSKIARNIAGEEYFDKGAEDNKWYYYRVRAIDQSGAESDSSPFVSAIATDTVLPATPVNVRTQTTAKGGKVTVSWDAPPGEKVVAYQIFRSTVPDLIGSRIITVTGRSYTDVSLPAGVNFYYNIKAVDKAGNLSVPSASVSALVVNENDMPLLVSDLQASSSGRGGEIRLSWRNPTISNFSHNRLYRSLGAGDRGSLIVNNIRGASHTDRKLINGEQYYYTVQAVSKGGVEYENLLRQVSASPRQDRTIVPPPVANPTAADRGDGSSLELKWQNPAPHTYRQIKIYRSPDPDQLGQLVAKGLRANSLIDKVNLDTDSRYYYTIKTVSEAGVESALNAAVGGIPTVALPGEGEGSDADQDGLPDDWERQNGYHPRRADVPSQDDDRDGLGLAEEHAYKTNPWLADSDDDGYDDGTEVGNNFNPAGAGRLSGGAVAPGLSGLNSNFAYGRARLASPKEEQRLAAGLRKELEKMLSKTQLDKAGKRWFLLVNAYIYGGYSASETASVIKFGPGQVHPEIPASTWRQSSEYKKYVQ